MAVSVIITRTIKDSSVWEKLSSLIVQLRSRAIVQPGYLNAQTFSCLDCEGEYLVISNWNTLEDWNRWINSEERLAIQNKVDDLVGEKTVYRYYKPVVGGITPLFNK